MLGERRESEREREENVLCVAGWTDSVVSTGCAERSATRQVGCSLVLLSSITVRPVARELSSCSVHVAGWNVCIGSGLQYLISCESRKLR
jgi:hypothetical protein